MTKRFRCAHHRWPLPMVILGLALLVIGILSFQHHKVSSDSVRQVQADAPADIPKDPGADQPQVTLADVTALVAALLRTDDSSSDPTPIEGDPAAERTEREPPVAVSEAPTDPRTGSISPMPMARASAAAVPEPPIQAGNDAVAQTPMPRPVTGGGDFGTALTFAHNPVEAANLAKRAKKLAFFLHVSGNFEDSGFT